MHWSGKNRRWQNQNLTPIDASWYLRIDSGGGKTVQNVGQLSGTISSGMLM